MERLTEEHASRPYNPDVANAFFRAGLIEAWGRGIERILQACKAASMPAPRLRYADAGLRVEFGYQARKARAGKKPGTTRETTQKTTQKILAVIRQSPSASRREIAAILRDITENGVKYHLDKLKSEGRIRRIGPAKGGKWQIVGEGDE